MPLNTHKDPGTVTEKQLPSKYILGVVIEKESKRRQALSQFQDVSLIHSLLKNHMKKTSTSLNIREMQIQATAKYHITLVRMAVAKHSTNKQCQRGCGEKGTLLQRSSQSHSTSSRKNSMDVHLKNNTGVLSVQFSRSVMSDSLQPHESQHARPPCPSPTPGVHSNSCPSSQ